MSVKLSFDSPSEEGVVQRSRSFTGFSSLSGRRRPSSLRNSLRSKAQFGAKYPRVHLSPSRVGGALSPQQPEQVDRIFQALRKGLKEYVEGHQAEMDFLSSQQRETKRNSRLAFLYDLEKELRALERHIRRLEFQISKVEELYETYCIQWRLCQGAINMKRAFALSPSSRASRDSLLELSRTHRHSLQDMSVMEGELEILLGELHIKMKGLIGFARLCPGDQYEVVVRLGRQRWRIRGRIQSDDRQYWDVEEMIFLPHIHHNFEIKVTEAKGLGWLLVGMVTCASADFFVARPQLMLVDITELGTIKLQLEVTWNPFDSGEKMRPVSPSRKSSVYSWTAPSTPSFTEKYFISMVRQLQDAEGPVPSLVPRPRPSRGGVSLLSYLSDPAHSAIAPNSTSTPITARSELHSSLTRTSSPSLMGTSVGGSQSQLSLGEEEDGVTLEDSSLGVLTLEDSSLGVTLEDGSLGVPGTLEDTQSVRTLGDEEWRGVSETKRCSTPDILRQNPETEPGLRQTSHSGQESPGGQTGLTPFPDPTPSPPPSPSLPPSPSPPLTPSVTHSITQSLPPSVPPSPSPPLHQPSIAPSIPPSGPPSIPPSIPRSLGRPVASWAQRRAQAVSVGTLIAELENSLQNHSCSEKELRMLDNQILHLATILKNDLSMLKSSTSSSEETLAVEEVLGSFDFLSDDDTSCLGSLRLKETGISSFQQSTLRSMGLLSHDSQSASEEELTTAPLTSGNWSLDQTLETHLDICTILLQAVSAVDFSLSVKELLEEMTLQAAVVEHINCLLLEKNDNISTSDILPQSQRSRDLLLFWDECVGDGSSLFCCHVDSFSRALRKRYSHKVKAKQPGQSETVFCQVLQGVLSCCGLVPSPRPVCRPERVTVFQLSVYLKRWNIQDLGQHITRLSKEVYFESALRSPKRRRALTKLRGRRLAELLPLGGTLQTLAALQVESNHKVCKAAARCLTRAAACKALRNKAIVFYTESLKHNDVQLQQAACLALKCLKATDSVDHIAELWRSTDEDLRGAARETVLSFGKKGFQAFQRMDQLYIELQEEAYRNQQTEITIL